MAFTKFTNLDYDQIKESIKDYLRANSTFTGFDFDDATVLLAFGFVEGAFFLFHDIHSLFPSYLKKLYS